MEEYSVFVKTDARGNIVEINSDYYLMDYGALQKVDSGTDLKYRDAARLYLPKGIISFGKHRAHFNYKLVDGKVVERTEEEKEREPFFSADKSVTLESLLDELLLALSGAPMQQSDLFADHIHQLFQNGRLSQEGLQRLRQLLPGLPEVQSQKEETPRVLFLNPIVLVSAICSPPRQHSSSQIASQLQPAPGTVVCSD